MKFLKSLFTDKQWDGDASKVMGFILAAIGIIGHFLNLEPTTNKWLVTTGAALVLGKSTAETFEA